MRAILDVLASQPRLHTLTVAEARARPLPLAAAPERVGSVVQRGIPGPGGSLAVRIYRPATPPPHPALVYFHGGGWVLGSLEGADALCRVLTNRAACAVVSVDYRLAPETKFPGPVEDAYAAVTWVWRSAAELGLDASRIAVGGSSAGGNLAAAATLIARDGGGPPLVYQLLLIPPTDLRFGTVSHEEFAEGYGLTNADCVWFARHYLAEAEDANHAHASILRAPDLRSLPPALVVTAECDPLRDEGEAYAERLRASGVEASFTRYPGMAHPFLGFPDRIDEARRAIDDSGEALRQGLANRDG